MSNRNNENNPRYSTYWINQGFSPEEAENKAKYKRRSGSRRCIEYWLEQGYSEAEGRERIRSLQSKSASQQVGNVRGEETLQKQRESILRRNQIETWIDEYGEELGTEKFLEFKQKQVATAKKANSARVKNNPNTFIETSVRRVEYGIDKGYSEQDAIIMVSKHQSRGLDFYVSKYGETEGLKRWTDRNKKWYSSFYESGKDLDEINQKRKDKAHVGYYTQKSHPKIPELNFYLLRFIDKDGVYFIKYGLTKQKSISKRWKVYLGYKVEFFESFESALAIEIENAFNVRFKKSYTPKLIKTTECFRYSDKDYKTAITIIEDFKNGKY
jgi:hypothetical protein